MSELKYWWCVFFGHRWIRPKDEVYGRVTCRRCKRIGSDIAFDFSGRYEDESK